MHPVFGTSESAAGDAAGGAQTINKVSSQEKWRDFVKLREKPKRRKGRDVELYRRKNGEEVSGCCGRERKAGRRDMRLFC